MELEINVKVWSGGKLILGHLGYLERARARVCVCVCVCVCGKVDIRDEH
jgi:hypothetical protein